MSDDDTLSEEILQQILDFIGDDHKSDPTLDKLLTKHIGL